MLALESHETSGRDAVEGSIKEDDASVVGHTGDLPRSHLTGLVTLVDNGIGNDDGLVLGIRAELLADAVFQPGGHGTGHDNLAVALLKGVGLFVKLRHGRPIPLLLRTGPESAAESLRPLRLRNDFLSLVCQRHNLGTLLWIDGHRDIAHRQLLAVLGQHCRRKRRGKQHHNHSCFHKRY